MSENYLTQKFIAQNSFDMKYSQFTVLILLSTGSAQCMTFCESLSEKEFKSYLKNEGVLEKDCKWLIGEDTKFIFPPNFWLYSRLRFLNNVINIYTDNGINAKAFLQLSDSHIDSEQFAITFGGKLILKKLLKGKCT